MSRSGLIGILLTLASANGAHGAGRITAAKNISAQAGPWVVTLSINYAYPYADSNFALNTQPAVFSAADGFGFRAGDVLTMQYVSGLWCAGNYVSTGTCVDANGYPNYGPANDRANGSVYAPSKYMDPATYPIYFMELVGAFADDRGQIVGMPFKVGNGPVNASIPAGATRLQLGSNLWAYGDARDYYSPLNVSVSGPPPPVMNAVGSIAHLAVGGPWNTMFVVMNSGTVSAQARLNFFDDGGRPLPLPLIFADSPSADPVSASTIERMLAAGASLTLKSAGSANQPTQQGWAQLVTDGSVTAFGVFGMTLEDRIQEVAAPLETRSAGAYALWFDQTGAVASGLALANLSTQTATVAVTIRDENGAVIATDNLFLLAQGHTAFLPADRWPQTKQRRGMIEFHSAAGGQIGVLGLRFNASAFTAIPTVAMN